MTEVHIIDGLVGNWFHQHKDDGTLGWQGQVLSEPQPGHYLVQLYGWLDGCPTDRVLVPFPDMLRWKFYETDEDMNDAYAKRAR